MDLKIVYLSPDDLTPYERNARKHRAADVDKIARSERAMGQSNVLQIGKEVKQAFPLGVGMARNSRQTRQEDREIERKVRTATDYSNAYNIKKSETTALANYEKALQQVKGTGKTLRQIRNEKVSKAVSESKTNGLKWKQTTDKTRYGNVTVRSAGGYTIRSSDGAHFVYDKSGNQIGWTDRLSKAKAIVASRLK